MNDYIKDIVIGYLNGTLTSSQKEDFYSWINSAPANKETYFKVKAIYDACKTENRPLNMEESWQRLLEKRKGKRTPLYTMKRLIAATASAAAITFLLSWALFHFMNPLSEEQFVQFIGKDGLEVDQIILPDGTEISLGTQTTLTYGSDYGKKERVVELDGEAFFNVRKAEGKPFKVRIHDSEIEVLGTQFNVHAYYQDSIYTTTLLEGKVKWSGTAHADPVFLTANQQFRYNRNRQEGELTNVDARQYTKWVDGYYYFPSQDLQTILNRLSNLYGVHFSVQSENLKTQTFTGTFYRGQSMKDILEIINLSIPIRYEIDELNVTISEQKNK